MRSFRLMCAIAAASMLLLSSPATAVADQTRDQEWMVSALNLQAAQEIADGTGVVVAVVDSGVRSSHIDLIGNVLPGVDLSTGVPNGFGDVDVDGHGTAMASLIAGHGHGADDGVLGVAPAATILPIRDGVHQPMYMAEAINWAVNHGAEVISISQGQQTVDSGLVAAIHKAVESGIIVVAAAGNRPSSARVDFPAALPGVLAVGGTDRSGNHYSASVAGPNVLISAPAEDVVAAYFDGRYARGSGTSSSTAIIAGTAALIREAYPHLSAQEVIHRLEATAIDKGPPGRDDEFGYGLVNIVAALTAKIAPLTGPSVARGSSPLPSRSPTSRTAPSVVIGPSSHGDDSGGILVLIGVGALTVIAVLGGGIYFRQRSN
jgi:type VII secretion-associated serine protease mycosin